MEGRSSKMRAGEAASDLTDDPLVEILSRVPAKSICRFKCVSKAWRDLIADPDHRKKLRQAMQGLLVQRSDVYIVDKTRLAPTRFSFIDLSTARSVPLDIDPSFSFLVEMTGIINFFFLDYCNGLILFGHDEEPHLWVAVYTVCNPATKQWLQVPACSSRDSFSHTYLAFDPAVSSHFHLVQFQVPNASVDVVALHVYSSETGTWSQNQIDKEKDLGQLEGWHHRFTLGGVLTLGDPLGTFVNGFLHLMVSGLDGQGQHILAVDVQGKARSVIAVPGMAVGRPGDAFVCYLGQSQGYLHCVTLESADNVTDKLSVWVLKNYDTLEWVLKNTVDSSVVFGETKGMPEFQVVGIHQDCNVIFFFHQLSNCKLMAYNMDRKEVSLLATFEDEKSLSDFAPYIPYFSESPALTNKHF